MRMKLFGTAAAAALALGLTGLAAPASAQDAKVAFNVGVTSDYVFRGYSQTNEDPAIQGGVDLLRFQTCGSLLLGACRHHHWPQVEPAEEHPQTLAQLGGALTAQVPCLPVFVQQSFKLKQRTVQPSPAQRWGQMVKDHGLGRPKPTCAGEPAPERGTVHSNRPPRPLMAPSTQHTVVTDAALRRLSCSSARTCGTVHAGVLFAPAREPILAATPMWSTWRN